MIENLNLFYIFSIIIIILYDDVRSLGLYMLLMFQCLVVIGYVVTVVAVIVFTITFHNLSSENVRLLFSHTKRSTARCDRLLETP